MKNKKTFGSIVFVTVIVSIVSLHFINFTSPVLAVEIKGDNALQILKDSSTAELRAAALRKCVPDHVASKEGANKSVMNSDLEDVGPWLADKITGGDDSDGIIKCDENDDGVIDVFASGIGLSRLDILCNKNDDPNGRYNQPGLVALYQNDQWKAGNCKHWASPDDGGDYGGYFKQSNTGGTFYFYPKNNGGGTYSNGEDYVADVFNEWKRNNKAGSYTPSYFNIKSDSLTKHAKYFLARSDYVVQCGTTTVGESQSGANGVYAQKVMQSDGSIKTEYYQARDANKEMKRLYGGKLKCSGLNDEVNKYVADYRAVYKEIFKDECDGAVGKIWEFNYYKALFISGQSEYSTSDRVVVTPGGIAKADTQDMQKFSRSLPDWEKEKLVWRNYTESQDEEGNTTYEMYEITDKDKSTAQQVVTDYNERKSAGTYVKINGDQDTGSFVCVTPEGYTYSEADVDSGSDTSDSAEDTCQNAGGAGSLGWIVCPILDWMQDATDEIYTNYVEPSLQLKTELFTGGNDATKGAWDTFQGFANVLFIILFLAIIFSQLTGVGIDNYGIKKLLPKLVVVAILVNLSYLICIICVDLSNILGNALKAMFDNLPVDAGNTLGANSGSAAGATAITAVILVGAIFAMGVAVWQNPAILLTLLVGVLGVLISIFFLFILLSARQAAVVVLTVASPLAFACYMLPNTKKLFDRWLKFWEAMLLLYPICGLLIGGGDFVSRLLLATLGDDSGGNFFGAFTAMIVGIIPIFFIPTVLKSSFAALGTIGSKITGFGKTAQGWATGKMRNSEGYKNAQKMGLDRKVRKQAGLDKQGDPTRLGRVKNRFARTGFGRFIGSDTRLAAKTAATKKNIATQEEAGATLMQTLAAADMADAPDIIGADGNSLFKGKRENYYGGEFLKAAKSGDRKRMNAALAAAKSAGVKDSDIAKMVRHAESSGALDSLGDSKARWLQSQAASNNAFAKDVELQHWASRGGVDSKGGRLTLGDYGDYASGKDSTGKRNMDATDLDKSKISSASAESLAGLIKAGDLIGSGLAEQTLSDASTNLSPEKSIMLGAVKEKSEGKLTVSVTHSAKDLKEDAVSLSGGGNATNGTINASSKDVERWTAPPAERVTVDQQKPNEVPVNVAGNVTGEITIHHEHHNNPNPNPNNGGETFEGGSGI